MTEPGKRRKVAIHARPDRPVAHYTEDGGSVHEVLARCDEQTSIKEEKKIHTKNHFEQILLFSTQFNFPCQ